METDFLAEVIWYASLRIPDIAELHGKFCRKPMIFHGKKKKTWFPVKSFPSTKSIQTILGFMM